MNPAITREVINKGGSKGLLGRVVSGESLFMNKYQATGANQEIAFAGSFPGSVLPIEIKPGKTIIAQKTAFLAMTENVDLSIFFRKKFGAGLFGGEGFIMEKFSGEGMAFLEIDGYVKEYELKEGEQLVVDTGYLAAMEESCSMDIVNVGSVKTALFGGDGIFNTVITGPGRVWLQTMPVSALANKIKPFIPTSSK